METKRGRGQPRIIQSPEEFDRLVDEYVSVCEADGRPLTFTGMALHLGFADRRSFYDYQKHEEFSRSVLRARTIIEGEYEMRIAVSGDKSCGGAIFALKNHGWADKLGLEHSGPDGGAVPVVV